MLFAFHGYGEEANTFYVLEELLGKDYSIIAIDFPFHGATEWKEGLLFTTNDLLKIISQIHTSVDQRISLLGYSMGGRVSLHLLQLWPEKIKRVVLIAPDGLHHNFWHWLSTQTFIGNKLFRFSMHQPKWLFFLMKLAYKTGLFHKSIYNFVHYHLDDKASRLILYQRWTTMRKFSPNLLLLRKIITENKIPMRLVFGKYDRVIVTEKGDAFQKGAKGFIMVKELEAGHQLLKQKYAAEIAALFRS